MLRRDAILAAARLERETVHVPEWGGDVLVQELTAAARDDFERALVGADGRLGPNIRARLVALSVVDEDGNRLFSDADVAELAKQPAKAMDRVFSVAQRLSGLRPEDLEEAAKN